MPKNAHNLLAFPRQYVFYPGIPVEKKKAGGTFKRRVGLACDGALKIQVVFIVFSCLLPIRPARSIRGKKRIRPGGREAQLVPRLVCPFYDPAGKFIAGVVKRADNVKKR
jgi:hypothetical protein